MKIAILTLPLHTNYGGLLQAYALQAVLKRMGHEVWIVNNSLKRRTLLVKVLSIAKRLVLFIFYRKSKLIRVWPTTKEENIIAQNTNRFIQENIRTIEKRRLFGKLSFLRRFGFEAYIVGSDQVWRPKFSPSITNYFFDFVNKNDNAKRLAFAASFGVDYWEFSSKLTAQCAVLAKSFNAISVREESAVRLCKEYLGIDAIHVLDPTMLLMKEHYMKLIEKDNIPKSKGTLLTYILDNFHNNYNVIQSVAKEYDLTPFSVMPERTFLEVGKNHIGACIFPPVTEWLRAFLDAEYIVTDSFHGTAFSIIFNKPFLSISNKKRGMTRITSLLNMFGLEERLILTSTEVTLEKIKSPIDFQRVNNILENEKQKSLLFLESASK